MRPKDRTTTSPLWGSDRSLTSPTSAFLTPGLPTTATHLAAGLGRRCPQSRVSLLPDERLVHHRHIDRNLEHIRSEFNLIDRFATHITHRNLHGVTISLREL
jgi:hypothetical protein